jgi:hypothetical protein
MSDNALVAAIGLAGVVGICFAQYRFMEEKESTSPTIDFTNVPINASFLEQFRSEMALTHFQPRNLPSRIMSAC